MEKGVKDIHVNYINYKEGITYQNIQEILHYAPLKPSFSYNPKNCEYAAKIVKRPNGTITA